MELQDLTQKLVCFFQENSSNAKCTNICKESRLKEDLELDSLDTVELIMKLEDEYCVKIPDEDANKLITIADVAVLILKLNPKFLNESKN